MCRECQVKHYESFDELPQELRDKFKSPATTKGNIKQAQKAFLRLVNLLERNGDKLIGDYTCNSKKVIIKYGSCGHIPPKGITPTNYFQDKGCGVCYGNQVQIGVNDIAHTHPHLTVFFNIKEDAFKYTSFSSKQVEFKCINCGFIKKIRIDSLTKRGFCCPYCSDGVSYPNKVMALLVDSLGLDYKLEHTFDGYGQFRFDIYLPKHGKVIENDGGQHYAYLDDKLKDKKIWGNKTGMEIHYIDLGKEGIVINEGLELIPIDCRKSNIDYIRNSVEQCEFFQQFDLSSIDWEEIDRKAQTSQKIDVCKRWREGKEVDNNFNTTDLIKEFGISRTTIVDYLTWGNDSGLCEYNPKKEKQLHDERCSVFIYLIQPDGNKWFNKPMSLNKLSAKTGITKHGEYNKPLKGINASYNKKYIGSYIVLAEEWDRNKTLVFEKCMEIKPNKFSKYYFIDGYNNKWFDEKLSIKNISEKTGINDSTLGKYFKNNEPLQTHSNSKFDPKYIGSRVVLAEEYDKEHGSN